MYQKGDYIVYGLNGACLVENITDMDPAGSGKKRTYYILRPMTRFKGTIYCPVDNQKAVMRKIISREAAETLLKKIEEIPVVSIANDKLREEQYKLILSSCDLEQCLSLIKTLFEKRKQRIAAGRKFTSVDERYLKSAGDVVNSELSVIMGEQYIRIEDIMRERLQEIAV